MKQVIDPGPIEVRTLQGERMREPIRDENGEPMWVGAGADRRMLLRDATGTLKKFCLDLIGMPPFIGDKKGIDAAELLLSARKTISSWTDGAGPKLLEDEHQRGLSRCVREQSFDPQTSHNFVPYMRAIVDAKEAPNAVLANPDQAPS